jgi:7,8-dihydropterin-6-yl-methyl-4-(beta-D-ribofuranosyl)aminobenzene 5'-phosphate synthase
MRPFTLGLVTALVFMPHPVGANEPLPSRVGPTPVATSLKITVLSTMLADRGIGEWGYAALVEVDGRRILFDTGARPETVLRNAEELRADLSDVTDVILSHNHADHTGGLLTLRRELMRRNPSALSRVHVAQGIFWSRPGAAGAENNFVLRMREQYESTGGVFIEHARAVELAPGVWFTGPVPRRHSERNWSGTGRVRTPEGLAEDNVPEDASLVIDTADGLVVLSGCGHAGIVNTTEYARTVVRNAPIHAVVGGLHLFAATDDILEWTGDQLRAMGVRYLLAGHCTGIEATYRFRDLLRLNRQTAAVSAVGSSFTLGVGIDPLQVAR